VITKVSGGLTRLIRRFGYLIFQDPGVQ